MSRIPELGVLRYQSLGYLGRTSCLWCDACDNKADASTLESYAIFYKNTNPQFECRIRCDLTGFYHAEPMCGWCCLMWIKKYHPILNVKVVFATSKIQRWYRHHKYKPGGRGFQRANRRYLLATTEPVDGLFDSRGGLEH